MTGLVPFLSSDAAVQAAWADFAQRQSNGGKSQMMVRELNLLNEFLHVTQNAEAISKAHPEMKFSEIKSAIEKLCQTQSLEALEKGPERTLNDHIVEKLMEKWIPVLSDKGFYPPPEGSSISHNLRAQRLALRQTPDGQLIAGALMMATLGTTYGACKVVRRKLAYVENADLSGLESDAVPVMENTLFRFNDSKVVNKENPLGVRFKNYLFGRVETIVTTKTLLKIDNKTRSMDAEAGGGDERTGHERMADPKSADPQVQAEISDQIAKVEKMMGRFSEREQNILRMRFGLNDEKQAYTLEEVGEHFEVSRERIRQIEARMLRIMRTQHEAEANGASEMKPRISAQRGPGPAITQIKPTDNGTESAWIYEEFLPRSIAIGIMEDAREAVVGAGGAKGAADIAIKQIEMNSKSIPPMMEGAKLLRMGQLREFDELLQQMRMHYQRGAKLIWIAPVEAKEWDPPKEAMPLPRPVEEVKIVARTYLEACFSDDNPTIDVNAMGVERAYAVGRFFKMLRESHDCKDLGELAKKIALANPAKGDKPAMIGENLRQAVVRMRVGDDELDKPITDEMRTRNFRTILVNDPAGLNYPAAIAQFAFPGDDQLMLRDRCLSFLSSTRYWARTAASKSKEASSFAEAAPRAAVIAPTDVAELAVPAGFVQKVVNTDDAKTLGSVRQHVMKAREAFAAMKGYDREAADAIATGLFNGLTEWYSLSRVAALSEGSVNGKDTKINSGTLSRWRSGRKEGDKVLPVKVDIDTVMQVADALAHSIIPQNAEGAMLAKEAAAYMSGLPWVQPKDKVQMMHFVQHNGLDTGTYMLLSRKQVRMQQHEFEKHLRLPHERYAEMIATADKKYARINLGDFEGFIERMGFEHIKDKVDFRRMVQRKPPADYHKLQSELVTMCHEAMLPGTGTVATLPAIVEKLQEVHGTRHYEDLVDAICNMEQKIGNAVPQAQRQLFGRELHKYAARENVYLPHDMVRWVVQLALPEPENSSLREGLVTRLAALHKPMAGQATFVARTSEGSTSAGGAVGGGVGG